MRTHVAVSLDGGGPFKQVKSEEDDPRDPQGSVMFSDNGGSIHILGDGAMRFRILGQALIAEAERMDRAQQVQVNGPWAEKP